MWQGRRDSTADDQAVCDCTAEKLFDLVLNEVEELLGSETQRLSNLCKDLLNSMPRHISAVSEVEPGTIETEITWETSTSKHFKTSFDVFVFSGDYHSIEKAEHRFHDLSNPEIGSGYFLQQSPDNDPSSVSQTIG